MAFAPFWVDIKRGENSSFCAHPKRSLYLRVSLPRTRTLSPLAGSSLRFVFTGSGVSNNVPHLFRPSYPLYRLFVYLQYAKWQRLLTNLSWYAPPSAVPPIWSIPRTPLPPSLPTSPAPAYQTAGPSCASEERPPSDQLNCVQNGGHPS